MTCPDCHGYGMVKDMARFPDGVKPCPTCKGRGTVCSHCGGTGVEPLPCRDRGRAATNYHCTVCQGSGEEQA